jgi:RNA polymerase sigma factor (sigma-70 family)
LVVTRLRCTIFKKMAWGSDQCQLQDMFLAIWQALASFKDQSSLHTFVYKVAYNQALSHVTKQSRQQNFDELSENIVCQKSDVESYVSNLKSVEYLTSKIGKLPIIQRQLVVLSLEGVSYGDIAEISGLSVTNVGAQLNRAKTKLKQLLEKE